MHTILYLPCCISNKPTETHSDLVYHIFLTIDSLCITVLYISQINRTEDNLGLLQTTECYVTLSLLEVFDNEQNEKKVFLKKRRRFDKVETWPSHSARSFQTQNST